MATVNDEDFEFARKVAATVHLPCRSDVVDLHAASRERIEARVRAECAEEARKAGTHAIRLERRIADLEAERRDALGSVSRAYGAMDEFTNLVPTVGWLIGRDQERARRLVENDKRIAYLEAQLADWEVWAHRLTGMCGMGADTLRAGVDRMIAAANSARDHAISFQAANVARCERFEDALEKAERALADAKPVLTAEDALTVRAWRGGTGPSGALVAIIDRLCPPPKAPLTDAELIAQYDVGGIDAIAIVKALRARGAK